MLLLIYAFLTFDFSVRYVAINTNLRHALLLPHHRGVGRARGLDHPVGVDALALHADRGARYRRTSAELYPWVLAVMLGIAAFFLLVMTVPRRPSSASPRFPPTAAGSTRCWKTPG